jgi:hypothetical protein
VSRPSKPREVGLIGIHASIELMPLVTSRWSPAVRIPFMIVSVVGSSAPVIAALLAILWQVRRLPALTSE